MGYRHDMSQETDRKELLPEGWREFEILSCEEQVSKQGNDMFKFVFVDVETRQEEEKWTKRLTSSSLEEAPAVHSRLSQQQGSALKFPCSRSIKR